MNKILLNALFYQATWFASVLGAARGYWWAGAVVLMVFAAWQLGDRRSRGTDLRLVAVALLCGLVIDSVLAWNHIAFYAAPQPSTIWAPVWILVMWAGFALTLNHSLALLQRHLLAGAVLGAVGAPLAYLAAGGFHAVAFAPPSWIGLAWLAITWALALPLLLILARRWSAAAAQVPA